MAETMREFKLGSKVRDKLTGFIGYATARCRYINGCVQYEVTPAKLKDGVPQKEWWIDWQRLEKYPPPAAKKKDEEKYRSFAPMRVTGGPQNTPSRNTPPGSIEENEDE